MQKNQFDLQHLLHLYTKILTITLSLFAVLILIVKLSGLFQDAQDALFLGVNRSADMIEQQQQEVNQLATNLTNGTQTINNYRAFFKYHPDEYLSYSQMKSMHQPFYYIPFLIHDYFQQHPTVTSIHLTAEPDKKMMVLTPNNISGKKVKLSHQHLKDLYYVKTLVDTSSLNVVGTLFVNYDRHTIQKNLARIKENKQLQVLVLSDTSELRFAYHKSDKIINQKQIVSQLSASNLDTVLPQLRKAYFVKTKQTSNGNYVLGLIAKKQLYQKMFLWAVGLISLAVIIDLFLWWSLRYIFKGYRRQIDEMAESMDLVAQGDFKTRLAVPNKAGELQTLSLGINEMLNAIDQYILQIYQLQIAQKDANMMALQAQINPHFLYNTLEYIRMYAVTEGQLELADVVFNFASLLRNNINTQTTVTLAQEFEFAEKYIYLHQVRYPDQLAYDFQLAPEVANLQVAKFIIQPLIENYFKHGIDLNRTDNVISLKAYPVKNKIIIEVIDNGQGIDEVKLKQLNHDLQNQNVSIIEAKKSVGLLNVKARLTGIFGDYFKMQITTNKFGGTTVLLMIDQED